MRLNTNNLLVDFTDAAKRIAFNLSGLTAARTLTVPNASGTIALTSDLPTAGVAVKDEGGASLGQATTFDFVGAGVTATFNTGTATITISGGGGGVWSTSSLGTDAVTLVNRTAFYRALIGNSTLSFSGVAEGGEYRFYFTASGANRDVIIPAGHYTPGGQKTFTIEGGNTLPMELLYVNSIYMWTIGAQIKA